MEPQDWSRRKAMAALGAPVALGIGVGGSEARAHSIDRSGVNIDEATRSNAIRSVAEMGAIGDGRTDDTRAFQETVNWLASEGGGTMVLPPGVYRTGTVHYPYEPVAIRTSGAGTGRTIWKMASPDRPIIAIDPREPPKRSMSAHFESFTVEAHPRGRADNPAQVAINCVGFSDVLFEDLGFRSDGHGSVGAWFHTAAYPHLSYHQRFRKLVCQKNVGPGCVIRTANQGSALTNTNVLHIEDFWIYANSQMKVAFDLARSTSYTIRQGLIESSGCDGILLGNAGIVEAIWIEDLTGRPVGFVAEGAAISARNILRDVYLSGYAGELTIPRDCINNILSNVGGGNFTISREDPRGGNIIINSGESRPPPRIHQILGPAGKLQEVQAYRASSLGERWNLLYEFAPVSVGTVGFRVVPSRGSHLVAVQVSALVKESGRPLGHGEGWPVGDFVVSLPDSQTIAIVIQLSLE